MTRLRLLLAAAASLGLAACGNTASTPDYAGGTPNVAALSLETSGGTVDGLASAPTSGMALTVGTTATVAAATLPAPCAHPDYEWTCDIHHAVGGLNFFVRAALEPVEALVASGPVTDLADDLRVYGPMALPVASPTANFKLTVRYLGNDTFRWKLEAQPTSPAGAPFVVVMAGQLHRGDAPHRGRGFVGIDLDQLNGVNAVAYPGHGQLLAAFVHGGGAKVLTYAVHAFSPDGVASPVTAVFTGWKNALGLARVRLAALDDVVPASGTAAANELLLGRVGFWPLLGGRTALAVIGGNVPDYSTPAFTLAALIGLECFDATPAVTYRARFYCGTNVSTGAHECHPDSTFNTSGAAVGLDTSTGLPLAGACALGTDAFDPAGVGVDASSTAQEPGAPTDLVPDAPPAAMPIFN